MCHGLWPTQGWPFARALAMIQQDWLDLSMAGQDAYQLRPAIAPVTDNTHACHDCLFVLMNNYNTYRCSTYTTRVG